MGHETERGLSTPVQRRMTFPGPGTNRTAARDQMAPDHPLSDRDHNLGALRACAATPDAFEGAETGCLQLLADSMAVLMSRDGLSGPDARLVLLERARSGCGTMLEIATEVLDGEGHRREERARWPSRSWTCTPTGRMPSTRGPSRRSPPRGGPLSRPMHRPERCRPDGSWPDPCVICDVLQVTYLVR
ncbi:hypothetical protein GCM10009670_20810 [Citricoccus alkalitolerans]